MTNTPRSILMPYLKEISLAEIACHDKEKEIKDKRNEIQKLENVPYPDQVSESLEGYWYRRYKLFAVLGFVFVIPIVPLSICLLLYPIFYEWSPWIEQTFGISLELDCFNDIVKMLLIGGVFLLLYGLCQSRMQEAERYFNDLEIQRHQQWKWEQTQDRIAELYSDLEQLESEFGGLKQKRDKIYSRNIIPYPYRSMYPVVYLYDYFRGCDGCQQEDFPTVLQTFVMDSKLDKVIEELREIHYLLSMM